MTYEAVSQSPNDPPKKKPNKCQNFLTFLYNPKDKTCLGRTAKSWLLIFIFYVIYYACLSGFFIGMLSVLMNCFIDRQRPMYTGDNNILRFQAGLNIQPRMTKVHGASIYLNSTHSKEYLKNYKKLFKDQFLGENYQVDGVSNCTKNPKYPKNFCIFPKDKLGPCANPEEQLESGKLCVFVRLNKVFGWVPEIKNSFKDVLIECKGQNDAAETYLKTPTYYPSVESNGTTYGVIKNYYFPYLNQKNYTSPMIAVQFPNMSKNLALLSKCETVNVKNSYGHVRFDLMLINVTDDKL